MAEKVLTQTELIKHIEETSIRVLEEQFKGTKVAEVVSKAVEAALAPVRGDLTKTQEETKALADRFKATSEPASALKKTREKGNAFGRIVRALASRKGSAEGAATLLKKWGDEDLADLMLAESKQVTLKAMTAGDPETGGVLIPQVVSSEIIDILRASVVVRRMGPMSVQMPSGNLRLPKVTQGTSAYYVGESTAATPSQMKVGSVNLSFKKLVTITPMSNDLLRYSSPGADQLVRNDITRNMSVRENQAFLRDTGTDATPKGLLQWALDNPTQILNAAATVSLANTTTDLGKIILKLLEADVPMTKPGWIMAPRTWNYLSLVRTTNGPFAFRDELLTGRLLGFPFAFTTHIPTTLSVVGSGADESDLYLADFDDIVIGDAENLIIDASGEAAYEESGTVKSAFHRDETVIRAIAEHDLAVRRYQSLAVLRGVKWV